MNNTLHASSARFEAASAASNDSRIVDFGVDGTGVAVAEYDHSTATTTEPGIPAVRPRTTRIVVGLDGSEASLDAFRRAVRIADGLNATVQTVVAWHNPTSVGTAGYSDWTAKADAEDILASASETLFGDNPPEWLNETVREGYPAQVLIEESKGAEMLVVGSRGHGGFAGLLLGSVSTACAEHAHCPVLVMHTPSR
ncbi:MAG: UspA domain protein [Subtercola sp.]|nr:UspA domain protein [Subtercola sp.]